MLTSGKSGFRERGEDEEGDGAMRGEGEVETKEKERVKTGKWWMLGEM